MTAKIIKISGEVISIGGIDEVVEVLRRDGIVVYPTETFYGLGVNGLSEEAIRKVCRVKKRDPLKPLSVVISDLPMLYRIADEVPPFSRKLIQKFWPGPLTVILKASSVVPEGLQGKTGTIGVRLTGHKWVRSLVRRADFPITATSANISGKKEVSNPKEACELFGSLVDLIVDGGETAGSLPSTVVDLTGDLPRLVREGVIPSNQLEKYLSSQFDSPS